MKKLLAVSVLTAALLLGGCNKKENNNNNPSGNPSNPTSEQSESGSTAPSSIESSEVSSEDSSEPQTFDPVEMTYIEFYSALSDDPDVWSVISADGVQHLDYFTIGVADMGMGEDIDIHATSEATFTWDAGEGEFVHGEDDDGEEFEYLPDYFSQVKQFEDTGEEYSDIKYYDYDDDHFYIVATESNEATMGIKRIYTKTLEIFIDKESMWVERYVEAERERFYNLNDLDSVVCSTDHVYDISYEYTYEVVE